MARIFSGVRPSGQLHLGNYLGAIKNWVELQKSADQAIFAVVDYHGITTPYDPKKYKEQVLETAAGFLAAGIDAKKSLLIRQSKVPEHTELAWLLNTITPVSWLDRLPTYKEQLEKAPKYHHVGLLDYPVLMAADILLYKSNLVPVGEDQLPHIDLTNEILKKFNSMFGETFERIKPHIVEGARIMSLQDASKKMSKTGDEGISLSDSLDDVRSKIKKAVTDSGKEIKYDPKDKPAISNLLTIYHLLSDKEISEIEKMYEDKNYSDFKNDLAEVAIRFLEPLQKKFETFKENPDDIISTLEKCEQRAKMIASSNLKEIKEKMGVL
jgi:tryptophanyl-tRNA synthetase